MVTIITYFVHGTTTDNLKKISTGWLPGKLSELGIKQSQELVRQTREKKFDIVFCSDLKRAVDSAEITFGGKSRELLITADKRLRECNYGELNGQPESVVEPMMESCIEKPYPKGESYRDVEQRMRSFLKEIVGKYSGKHIALVAHKAPQLALDVILKKKSWKQAIAEDWRRVGKWQPGWDYVLAN